MQTNSVMQTILIADDEPDIREILTYNLTQSGYRCLTATDGKQAMDVLCHQPVDLILLDVLMPEMSGYELAQAIRNDEVPHTPYDLPIIFLTALGEEGDQLQGFELGADDYIAKPFSLRVVLARIEAVLRRKSVVQAPSPSNAIDADGLILHDNTYYATIDGKDIGLTKMEYQLLSYLMQHAGAVYSRDELLSSVWPDNGLVLDRTVDVTITRLRKKLANYKDLLKTKTGYGYYWEK